MFRKEFAKRVANRLAPHQPSKVTKAQRPKPFPNTSSLEDVVKVDAAEYSSRKKKQEEQLKIPIGPVDWDKAFITPGPPPASAIIAGNNMESIRWQVENARHLFINGIVGPFEIGGFLCNVEDGTGNLGKVAQRIKDANGNWY